RGDAGRLRLREPRGRQGHALQGPRLRGVHAHRVEGPRGDLRDPAHHARDQGLRAPERAADGDLPDRARPGHGDAARVGAREAEHRRDHARGKAPGDVGMTAAPSTTSRLDDLRRRIAALQTRFAELGTRAASAAADVRAGGAPPSEELLAQLAAVAQEFQALRDDVLETAASIEVVLPKPADTLVALLDLVPFVDAIAATLTNAECHPRHARPPTIAVENSPEPAGAASRAPCCRHPSRGRARRRRAAARPRRRYRRSAPAPRPEPRAAARRSRLSG